MKCKECQRKDVEKAFAAYHASEEKKNVVIGALTVTVFALVFGFVLGALIF